MKVSVNTIGTVGLVLVGSPTSAQAYLDPGTGSIVLQIAIGGLLALVATSKLYWRRLISFFHSKARRQTTDN